MNDFREYSTDVLLMKLAKMNRDIKFRNRTFLVQIKKKYEKELKKRSVD